MARKRNSFGQFIKEDGIVIRMPSFSSMLMYILILLAWTIGYIKSTF